MHCDHYDTGRCRSCALMGVPYAAQLAEKDARVRRTLAAFVPDAAWEPPVASPESGFRNKAKLVAGGAPGAVTLGILDAHRRGVDLRTCGLPEAPLRAALPRIAAFVDALRLLPYDVPKARGELKHVVVTVNPDGELMVRLVLRSRRQLPRIGERLGELTAALPQVRVVSVNLQPEHKAILDGPEEVPLTRQRTLPMQVNGRTLHVHPGGFFQTNTPVAAALYRRAAAWSDELAPASVWDLYCGIGGFALHLAAPGRAVTGLELSPAAVAGAEQGARELAARTGYAPRFQVADAGELASSGRTAPELVLVNPPRRGIGERLARWLDDSTAEHLLYSSCNADSLARDLAAMPRLRPIRAGLFDMFPQTHHHEVLVLLRRSRARRGCVVAAAS